jgi:hypothetical protein
MMKKSVDVTGKVFGKLTVLRLSDDYAKGAARWLCQCECGNTTIVFASNLSREHTKSCGCLKQANYKTMNLTHGATAKQKTEYPRSYVSWCQMRQRCNNQDSPAFKYYGARGITICERWTDYACFVADMGEPPDGTSLDRIDNDGPYSPKNCRWATKMEQARNKRSAHMITYHGETRSLVEWAEHLGIPRQRLHNRIFRGWDIDRVFQQPYRTRSI